MKNQSYIEREVREWKMKRNLIDSFTESEFMDNLYEFVKRNPTLTSAIVSVVTTIIMRVLFKIFF